jgi:foldase protein PrsA
MLAVSKLLFIVSAVLTFACGAKSVPPPAVSATAVVQPVTSPAVSADILAREPVANNADVKHILIGWKELGVRNERASNRSKADAEQQVTAILAKLKSGSDFDSLMRELSEDEGSANSGKVFQVAPDAQLVIEFRQISLRLHVNEIGVCESDFGFHIVKRYR